MTWSWWPWLGVSNVRTVLHSCNISSWQTYSKRHFPSLHSWGPPALQPEQAIPQTTLSGRPVWTSPRGRQGILAFACSASQSGIHLKMLQVLCVSASDVSAVSTKSIESCPVHCTVFIIWNGWFLLKVFTFCTSGCCGHSWGLKLASYKKNRGSDLPL